VVTYYVWDARDTKVDSNSVDKIVSNLPFEKQANFNEAPEVFFDKFIGEMIRVTKPDSLLVFLTRHAELLEKIALKKKLAVVSKINIINSGIGSEIILLKRNN
jgi:23S rRNA G2445 N2-methylase RlmL